eukprot:19999-Heterococcus_DN1.PRE.1
MAMAALMPSPAPPASDFVRQPTRPAFSARSRASSRPSAQVRKCARPITAAELELRQVYGRPPWETKKRKPWRPSSAAPAPHATPRYTPASPSAEAGGVTRQEQAQRWTSAILEAFTTPSLLQIDASNHAGNCLEVRNLHASLHVCCSHRQVTLSFAPVALLSYLRCEQFWELPAQNLPHADKCLATAFSAAVGACEWHWNGTALHTTAPLELDLAW